MATKKTTRSPSGPVEKAAKAKINSSLSDEEKIKLLEEMIRVRRFEERSLRSYQQGKIGGFLHLYIGQESVATGSLSVLDKNDHFITAYRDHGHALACGMSMNECMAELYGKATGCSRGKGGSMHFFAPDKNYWGGHGIVAGQTPLGLGLAYALKYQGIDGCALCYLGDGAVNQGVFHESLNLASLWDIPIVYIIENNGYSMGTSEARSSKFTDSLAKRAEAYDMAWESVVANHVYVVRETTDRWVRYAKEKSRPVLLELKTYRYRGHSVADANSEKYRTKEEIQKYQETMDPINVFRKTLTEEGVIDDEKVKEIEKNAKEEANAAAKFADESEFPGVETITENVYWETDNPDQRESEGRMFFHS
ncbi:pyruvate dehydrogenase (acetyl-transferring) E1 component subunit alpha [Puniceicoccus vermicola]|uniref:Pyruvate dehydrogenase E1 component subunit alpha n=1 Tax=Puniceicoccus vermicola TaxID=388746 RepID=A0A7X1E333_9BACT|nr:pyruvate dehydrogenase (acetyl-transferring) E1 component subunit alpha [Puniceicoccus vermicola]MBC2600666.1 pyruvate dehydrogenase (acetyl-transferring) E1 component subunit alpha [Puniceicoccus vermicola]